MKKFCCRRSAKHQEHSIRTTQTLHYAWPFAGSLTIMHEEQLPAICSVQVRRWFANLVEDYEAAVLCYLDCFKR